MTCEASRTFAWVLAGLLLLGLAACDSSEAPGRASGGDRTRQPSEPPGTQKTKQKKERQDKPKAGGKDREPEPPAPRFAVARIVDGDTIELRNGRSVRLLQVDTPELAGNECHAVRSAEGLGRLLSPGTRVRLESDPQLDRVDSYGRLLRYVHADGRNVNLKLVRTGAASVWFYDGDRGRYAAQLERAARKAKRKGRGLWGACPGTKLDPYRGVETSASAAPAGGSPGGDCVEGYTPCLPVGPDLDCADVVAMGKAPVRVTGSDPYRLDGDDDGIGCE